MANKKGIKIGKGFIKACMPFGVAFIMLVSIFIIWVFSGSDYALISNIKDIGLKLNSTIYYLDEETGEHKEYDHIVSEENRIWVDIDVVPPDMQNAFVAIEDERFYHHGGVDIKRTLGAAIKELTGGSTYGGSSITQQLVKNLTGDKERSKARKVREILRAISLERKLEKDEILELYLNTIFLGQNCYGVETAANRYFGKSVSDLTLAESACIAGITQYPTKYDPLINPENNKQKRELVLEKMLELKYIDEEEYEEAINEELVFNEDGASNSGVLGANSYFTDYVIEQAIVDIMEETGCSKAMASNMLNNGGLKIYSTIDPDVQAAMDKVYEDSSRFVKNSKGESVQSAMVISDPYTGQVKGIVGGAGKKEGRRVLNRATQTTRQPGSSIKPLSVYGPAIDTGKFTAASEISDKPIRIGKWEPNNDSRKFTGSMSLRTAIMRSQNIPAINIVYKLTPDVSYGYLTERMHFSTLEDGDINLSAMALGGMTNGVSVLEMTAAYSAFANGGMYHEPICYTKITDAEGNVIVDNSKTASNRVFSEDTAYIMCDLMKGVVLSGTGVGAKIDGMDTAGKTGTTDKSGDRWFAAVTPYYCGVTWYGYDSPQPVYASGNPALRIWKSIMDEIHKDLPDKSFKKPSSVKKITVCTNSGKLATSQCIGVSEYVTKKTASSSYCTGHKYDVPYYELPYEPEEEEELEGENTEGEENTEGTDTPSDTPNETPPTSEPTPPSEPTPNKPVIDLSGI